MRNKKIDPNFGPVTFLTEKLHLSTKVQTEKLNHYQYKE